MRQGRGKGRARPVNIEGRPLSLAGVPIAYAEGPKGLRALCAFTAAPTGRADGRWVVKRIDLLTGTQSVESYRVGERSAKALAERLTRMQPDRRLSPKAAHKFR